MNTISGNRLRAAVAWRYALLRNSLDFGAFRLTSRLFYGRTRPVTTEAGPLVVQSNDYRGFVVARALSPQRESKRIWMQLAKRHPALCVDVGANYGEFTALIAERGLPTLVIEPNAALADCLRVTFSKHLNVRVIDVAIADVDGEADLFTSVEYSGSGSLFARAAQPGRKFLGQRRAAEPRRVQVRRLDTLVPEITGQPPVSVLLKIDVEAAEGRVLSGASSLLDRCRWWRAIVEWNPAAISRAGLSIADAWRVFSGWPGIVIDDSADDSGTVPVLDALPAVPPSRTCDLLLGVGALP